MLLAIDSQIIIWGIKKQSTDGQEDMIERAENFFSWVDNNNHEILIPTIVIAEILTPETIETRSTYIELFNKSFIVANFDMRCTLKYAQLLHGRKEEIKGIMKENEIARQKMKADHLIIACALAHSAKCIYSYDPGLAAFAKGFIEVKELPPLPPKQTDLFSGTK